MTYIPSTLDSIFGKIITQNNHNLNNVFIYLDKSDLIWKKSIATNINSCATHFAISLSSNTFKIYSSGDLDISLLKDDDGNFLIAGKNYYLTQKSAGLISPNKPISGIIQKVLFTNTNKHITLSISEPIEQSKLVETTKTFNYISLSADYIAKPNDFILADTRFNSININLPSNPNIGDNIIILDVYKTFSNNHVILNGNGKFIDGSGLAITLDIQSRKYEFVYTDSVQGWRIS